MKTLLLLLMLFPLSTFAVKTERWEINSAQDFLRGKLNRLTVSGEGELHVGYGNTKLGEFAKEVWCSTVARDGTIYFGTGSPADVYAVGKDGQAGKLFQTDSIAVTALAVDSRGNVYAATLAEGKIFRIPAGKKEGAEFCRLRAPYVWSLVFDKDDRLYAGTGPDGKIYRIAPDGKAEEWFAAEESNILSLALDAEGALLAGGSDRGLLYRITEKNKGVVLHEFAHQLDFENLAADGTPALLSREQQESWHKVMHAEFAALRAADESGTPTLLNTYGASDPIEFFAVSVEAFFEQPHALRARHPPRLRLSHQSGVLGLRRCRLRRGAHQDGHAPSGRADRHGGVARRDRRHRG